jgi:hypothetical protein
VPGKVVEQGGETRLQANGDIHSFDLQGRSSVKR